MIHISDSLSIWITSYGSLALFSLVALGFLIVPMPQNLVVIFAGILVSQGKLEFLPAYFATFTGAYLAISLTYIIGKFGAVLLIRYGRYMGMTQTRIKKFDIWYERYGKWTLLIGYYFPILRRILGYGAGFANLDPKEFIVLTLIGSFIWSTLLLTIGYFIGIHGSILA